jgi:addiction module HigA family antidote
LPLHPGQVIQDQYLTPQKQTQNWLSDRLKWKLTRLNKLINGKGGVTAGSALDLARALHTKPEFWLELQLNYDLARAKLSAKSRKEQARS